MEIKQNSSPILYIKMVDSTTKQPKTGITSPTVYYSKAGSIPTKITTPVFSEIDQINMPGMYKLTLSNSQTNVLGFLHIHVSATNCDSFMEIYEIVANQEVDTYTLLAQLRTDATTTRLNKLDNLDTTISSRSQLTASDIWNFIVPSTPTVNSIMDRIKNYLDAKISDRATQTSITNLQSSVNNIPTTPLLTNDNRLSYLDSPISLIPQNVWSYTSRLLTGFNNLVDEIWSHESRTTTTPSTSAGIGSHILTVTVNYESTPSNTHRVILFDSNKIAILEAETGVEGQVIFNVNDGNYFVKVIKENVISQEQSVQISGSNVDISFDTSASVVPSYQSFTLTNKTKNYKWQPTEAASFICSVKCNENTEFSITNATYSYEENGSTVSGNCQTNFSDNTVYFNFNPLFQGLYQITISIYINNHKIMENFTVDVS